MIREDMRDEAAQELADTVLMVDATHGGRLYAHIVDVWQEIHAEEVGEGNLAIGYFKGQADLIVRLAIVLLEQTRNEAVSMNELQESFIVTGMKELLAQALMEEV